MTSEEFKRRINALVDEFAASATDNARRELLASLGALPSATPSNGTRDGSRSSQIIAMYNDGRRAADIAARVGCEREYVHTVVSRARGRGLVPPSKYIDGDDRSKQIIELRRQGMTHSEIARQCDLSVSYVHRVSADAKKAAATETP